MVRIAPFVVGLSMGRRECLRRRLYQFDFVVLHDPFTVDAPQRFRFHVEHLHFGRYRLVVGDTLRVGTFHYADDLLGELDIFLFHDLIIADEVEGDVRRDDGETIDDLVGEKFVGDLDDPFLAEGLAVEVVADGDGSLVIVEIQ